MANTQQPRNGNRNNQQREYREPIHSVKVFADAERKKFFLDLNENDRGVVLRIKEASDNGRFNFIMVPGESINDLIAALEEISAAYDANGR